MKNILFIPGLILLMAFAGITPSVAGAAKKEAAQKTFSISGRIINMPIHTVVLELLRANDSISIVDSQASDAAGNFTVSGKINEPGLYRLHFASDRFILLSIDGGNTKINAEWPINDYVIEGSAPSAQLKSFVDSVRSYMASLTRINMRADSFKATGNQAMLAIEMKALQDLSEGFTKQVKMYGDTTQYQANAILASRMLNAKDERPYMEAFNKSMQRRFPKTAMTRENQQQMDRMKESTPVSVEPGSKAPALSFEDPNGKTVTLASFKGQYVLIDFWASWCGPCRAENPNVVAAYNKYKNKKFTILGVSLDQKKDAWVKAIEADGLTWPQISDLKGWSSAAAAKYSVRSIPTNFLVDPKGIIVATNLRGPALESKLEELLK